MIEEKETIENVDEETPLKVEITNQTKTEKEKTPYDEYEDSQYEDILISESEIKEFEDGT